MLNTAASQLDRRYESTQKYSSYKERSYQDGGLKAARAYASEVAGSLGLPADITKSAERVKISGKVMMLRRLEKVRAPGNRVNHAFSSMLENKNASLASTFGTLSFANESESQQRICHSKNRSTATMLRRPTGGVLSQGTDGQLSTQHSQLPVSGTFEMVNQTRGAP